MTLKSIPVILFLIISCVFNLNGQVQISAQKTAQQLAQQLAGQGITISNAVLQCHNNANGFFKINSNILPIDSGIVLSTGKVADIASPENGATSSNNNTVGDPSLQALSGATITYDACILEFDMIPQGNQVAFDYVFASEEYINSVCGPFNDAFAFFISGPGITGTVNMAKVPGTNIPVTVNSVNNGIPGSQANGSSSKCTSMGPGAPFTQYYVDNTGGNLIAYRGLTSVFTAQADVIPCQTYHLKLTIADAQNRLYDSGVFIKAGSLKSQPVTINMLGSFNYNQYPAIYYNCEAGSVTFTRTQILPTAQNLTVITSGTAIAGVDYIPLPTNIIIPANTNSITLPIQTLGSSNSIKDLKIAVLDPFQCTQNAIADSGTLILAPMPKFEIINADTNICHGTILDILIPFIDSFNITWTPSSGVNYSNGKYSIQTSQSTNYIATASTKFGNCSLQKDSINIQIKPGPQYMEILDSIVACGNTTINIDPIIYPNSPYYSFLWQGPNGFTQNNKNISKNINELSTGWYYFTVSQADCGNIVDSIYIKQQQEYDIPSIQDVYRLCVNDSIYITTQGDNIVFYDNPWSMSGISNGFWFSSSIPSSHTYYVSQGSGSCISQKEKFLIEVIRCCENELFVPTAFSPNNDGLNDVFNIPTDFTIKIKELIIFNRWGEIVYKSFDSHPSWDGTYNNDIAEMGTYFYFLKYSCNDNLNKTKKGEITLIR